MAAIPTLGRIVPVTPAMAGTSAIAQVSASGSEGLLLAANTNRLSGYIYNGGSTTLYVRLSTGAATTANASLQVATLTGIAIPNYNGEIRGIWAGSPTGSASVTELTA